MVVGEVSGLGVISTDEQLVFNDAVVLLFKAVDKLLEDKLFFELDNTETVTPLSEYLKSRIQKIRTQYNF